MGKRGIARKDRGKFEILKAGLSVCFGAGIFIIKIGRYFSILYQTRTKESKEYHSRVAGKEHNVNDDFCQMKATYTFDNAAGTSNHITQTTFIRVVIPCNKWHVF